MGINLNLTQLALYGGGALVLWYMWTNKIPPFDKLEFPGLAPSEPSIEATGMDENGELLAPDAVPGKEGIVADFYNGTADYPPGGGTSGSLEDDFFITLARQKAILGDTPSGGGGSIETGDAPLYNQSPGQSSNYNNITFDKYGNTVIVPIPQNATDIATCKNSCMVSCGNMYNHDPAMKEACISGCGKVCSVHYVPPSSAQLPPYDQYGYGLDNFDPYQNVGFATRKVKTKKPKLHKQYKGKGFAYGRKRVMNAPKSFISRHASKINATMPYDETEVWGVGHNEKRMRVSTLMQSKMMLRPQGSSRNMLRLTCGMNEVCNV